MSKLRKINSAIQKDILKELSTQETGDEQNFFNLSRSLFLKAVSFSSLEKALFSLLKKLTAKRNFDFQIYELAKGQSSATCAVYSHGKFDDSREITAKDFFQLRSLVERSPKEYFRLDHSFNQKYNLIGNWYGITGSFLNNYYYVGIFSRNTFLDFENNEIALFNILFSSFVRVVSIRQISKKIKLLSEMVTVSEKELNRDEKQVTQNDSSYVLHKQRVALIGELLDTLKHEISNPLTGAKLFTMVLSDEIKNEQANEISQEIVEKIQQCEDIIETLKNMYSTSESYENVQLKSFVGQVLTLCKSHLAGIEVEIYCDENLTLKANKSDLIQVVFNLLVNASDSIKDAIKRSDSVESVRGVIKISVKKSAKLMSISIKDNGCGFLEDDMHKYSQAFFTTKMSGTGLGLAISKILLEKMNGEMTLKNNKDGNGAEVIINLFIN